MPPHQAPMHRRPTMHVAEPKPPIHPMDWRRCFWLSLAAVMVASSWIMIFRSAKWLWTLV